MRVLDGGVEIERHRQKCFDYPRLRQRIAEMTQRVSATIQQIKVSGDLERMRFNHTGKQVDFHARCA